MTRDEWLWQQYNKLFSYVGHKPHHIQCLGYWKSFREHCGKPTMRARFYFEDGLCPNHENVSESPYHIEVCSDLDCELFRDRTDYSY